jgi:hypothetical protein
VSFLVQEAAAFTAGLEEALLWLYAHNLEQSEEFADSKFHELEQEIGALKRHLQQTPYMGQADVILGIRRFPLYGGRYLATWIVHENAKLVTLLEFIDGKYPKALREFHFEE